MRKSNSLTALDGSTLASRGPRSTKRPRIIVDEYELLPQIVKRYGKSAQLFAEHFSETDFDQQAAHLYTILGHCEAARQYTWPEVEARNADADAIESIEAVASSARKVAAYVRRFPMQNLWAVRNASIRSGIHLRKKEDTAEIEKGVLFAPATSLRFADLLAMYAGEVDTGNLLARQGPLWHRTHHGPLMFAQAIDQRTRLPDRETCLALFLLFCFRTLAANGRIFFQPGSPMPGTGKPHWELIEQLVEDTFGSKPSSVKNAAEKFLKRNPNIMFTGYLSSADV